MKDFPDDFPSKDKKRGERKSKFQSIKHNTRLLAKKVFGVSDNFIDGWTVRHSESLNCNCWMCQNPRKAFHGKKKSELTIQERRAFQDDE